MLAVPGRNAADDGEDDGEDDGGHAGVIGDGTLI